MGYIQINTVSFSPTPASAQNVKIEYKTAGEPDSNYLTHVGSLSVPATGVFSPAVVISSLVDGQEYTVRITPLCGGTAFVENFFAGHLTTTTSTTAAMAACLQVIEDWGQNIVFEPRSCGADLNTLYRTIRIENIVSGGEVATSADVSINIFLNKNLCGGGVAEQGAIGVIIPAGQSHVEYTYKAEDSEECGFGCEQVSWYYSRIEIVTSGIAECS